MLAWRIFLHIHAIFAACISVALFSDLSAALRSRLANVIFGFLSNSISRRGFAAVYPSAPERSFDVIREEGRKKKKKEEKNGESSNDVRD